MLCYACFGLAIRTHIVHLISLHFVVIKVWKGTGAKCPIKIDTFSAKGGQLGLGWWPSETQFVVEKEKTNTKQKQLQTNPYQRSNSQKPATFHLQNWNFFDNISSTVLEILSTFHPQNWNSEETLSIPRIGILQNFFSFTELELLRTSHPQNWKFLRNFVHPQNWDPSELFFIHRFGILKKLFSIPRIVILENFSSPELGSCFWQASSALLFFPVPFSFLFPVCLLLHLSFFVYCCLSRYYYLEV